MKRRDPTIAAFGNGFDVAWSGGIVAERDSDFLHRRIQCMVEFNEGILGPDLPAQFFASDEFAGMFEQNREYLKGLFLEANARATLAQFSRMKIGLEKAEADDAT